VSRAILLDTNILIWALKDDRALTRSMTLPMQHRDPFDRLLIAQARAEGMALATADDQIRKYRVAMAW
jgi:PIN domain nuclease of toxin-antitoxin system